MKRILFVLFALFLWCVWFTFAQNILPDSAEISVKSPIIQWEATNMTITMMKNWSKMSSYNWEILMRVTDEEWKIININEYVLPNRWIYQFELWDLWVKEFQKWLEIKKVWKFYIEIFDYSDDDKVLWRQLVEVVKWRGSVWEYHIEVLDPVSDAVLTDENLKIIASVSELPNSNISIYVDDQLIWETSSDWDGNIYKWISNVKEWNHVLRLDCHDIEWNVLWSSDNINFTYMPKNTDLLKGIVVTPENGLKVGDVVKVVVNTDEMVEFVKLKLSDRSEEDSALLDKEWNWVFSQRVFLVSPWEVSMDLVISSDNNSMYKTYQDVKRIYVWGAPEIWEIVTDIDDKKQSAKISWKVENGIVSGYIVNYWMDGDSNFSWQKWTDLESFVFTNVPYDKEIFMNITPYREGQQKHWAASKTVQFVISKPSITSWQVNLFEANVPKCTVQNISLRTTKIWDSYYLMWDKVENVSKYIVYSSVDEAWKNKTKVYETSDTSYEYPFDHTAEHDQFLYFWVVWICEDGEELELSGATKVQVGPAENFFLLLCLTLMIYFWIKLFKETEV